jgi:tetratricopeptide (TPR) repeat protein
MRPENITAEITEGIVNKFGYQIIMLLLCIAINTGTQAGATENQAFEQGSQAFKAGDYSTALNYFNQARAAGNQKPTLIYNQGVTLYKLGRFEEAALVFEELLANRKWIDLARYNLGRIAEDRNDNSSAYDWYYKVSQHSTNEKLRGLAQKKLTDLAEVAEKTPTAAVAKKAAGSKKGVVLLSLGAANDDNATSMADELSSRSSDTGDTYLNALVYGHRYLSGQRGAGVKLYGLTYARRFQTYSSFDATVMGMGGTKEMTFDDLTAEFGGRFIRATVDSGHLANQYTISAKLEQPLPVGRAELDYQSSYFDAAEAYAQITGWQHQLQLAWRHSLGKITIEPAIKWQTNQREDREVNGNYYSYSPTSLGFIMDLKWKLSSDLSLHSGLEWSQASYSGENRMTDIGGVAKEQQRENQRQQWVLGANYRLSSHWTLKGEYSHTNVDDEFDIYSYDKNVLGVKLEFVF